MIQILEDARLLIMRPGNDFSWSSWRDVGEAANKIDCVLRSLRAGESPQLSLYFLPTGPLQELALSSGWGDEFLALANRFDDAMKCDCERDLPPLLALVQALGMDGALREGELMKCESCGCRWLSYRIEDEAFFESTRLCLVRLPENSGESDLHNLIDSARRAPWHLVGGSYFAGNWSRVEGPPEL